MSSLMKFIPRIFVPGTAPLQLVFFITAKCNLRCRHCFYLNNLKHPQHELSTEEIEKVSAAMGGLLWLALTGGEPFLREDIVRIAEVFYRNNKFSILTITTNGMLQDAISRAVPQIAARCKDAQLVIYVSLDGLEETHNRIRGSADSFRKAIETIRQIKSLKNSFRNLSVITITTCNAENQNELKELALFLKEEIRPDSIAINLLRGEPRSTALGEIDLKHYFEFIDIQKQGWACGDFGYYLSPFKKMLLQKKELLQKELLATIFREDKYMLPCRAGEISCMMAENGNLYPCEVLGRGLGNIREEDYNFNKLWHSQKAKEIRKFIKDSKCFCTWECAMTTNILFNPRQLFRMLGR